MGKQFLAKITLELGKPEFAFFIPFDHLLNTVIAEVANTIKEDNGVLYVVPLIHAAKVAGRLQEMTTLNDVRFEGGSRLRRYPIL